MPFNCEFSSAFSSAFAICTEEPPTPTGEVPTLRGVPAAIPRTRKRPEVTEISGVGYVSVLGVGSVTGEACLFGELDQPLEISGELVADTFRFLVGAIRAGAEAVLSLDGPLAALAVVAFAAEARVACEAMGAGVGTVRCDARAMLHREQATSARASIRTGAEARIVAMENEDWLLMAAEVVRRML